MPPHNINFNLKKHGHIFSVTTRPPFDVIVHFTHILSMYNVGMWSESAGIYCGEKRAPIMAIILITYTSRNTNVYITSQHLIYPKQLKLFQEIRMISSLCLPSKQKTYKKRRETMWAQQRGIIGNLNEFLLYTNKQRTFNIRVIYLKVYIYFRAAICVI